MEKSEFDKNLEDSIEKYEMALSNFGKDLAEIINLNYHHSLQEQNYDEFVQKLEEAVPKELTKKENAKLLEQIITALNKVKNVDEE